MKHDEKEISKKILEALKRQHKPKIFDKNRLIFSSIFAFIIIVFWNWKSELKVNLFGLGIQNGVNENSQPQLNPKEVITQYYNLAPSDRISALNLLSDEYKAWYNQNDGGNSAKSFWNTIQTVEIYAFLTLSQSENKHQIKVWLKYLTVDGYTACESQVIEVVLSQTENKWLIDKTGNVEQKFNCEQ
ncbi:MAG: hypothetical protein HLUCCO16_08925 [Phormidium sp. OSCR]|nr:MAG: hypothetical protein HLUCCO16_08925 [Phormidium sp. OSCR]